MKRVSILISLLLISLILPMVSAININMKQNFQPGETLLASIESNLLSPISSEDVYFYSDRQQIPLIYDVAKIQGKTYIYAQLPVQERNYILQIKNINYFENGEEKTSTLESNFTVSGNITDFSVSPGFIIATSDFSLLFESKSQTLDITAKFLGSTQNITVPAGQKKKIIFSIQGITNFTVTDLLVSSLNTKYSLPAAIIPEQNASESQENITESQKFRFNKDKFYFTVRKNNRSQFSIYLQNLNNDKISDVSIEIPKDIQDIVTLDNSNIDSIDDSSSQQINFTIQTSESGSFNGQITANYGNYSTTSDIIITSLDENASINNTSSETESCIFLGGDICVSGQQCNGNTVASIEGSCCIGTCETQKSYTGVIIGIILLIAVAAGVFFLYKKSRKKPADIDEILKERQKKFESRSEVRGSLSKE